MSLSLVVPGITVEVLQTGNLSVIPAALNTIGIVGTFERGVANAITTLGSISEALGKLGNWNDALSGMKAIYLALTQNQTPVKAVRIVGGTAAEAAAVLTDTLQTTIPIGGVTGPTGVIPVTSTYGFKPGDIIQIGTGAGTRENGIIATVDAVGGNLNLTAGSHINNSYLAGAPVIHRNVAALITHSVTGGDTSIQVASTAGLVPGRTILIGDGVVNTFEEKVILAITDAFNFTITVAAAHNHAVGEAISQVDTAATVATLSALTEGAFGNAYTVTITQGSTAGTAKITINGDGKQEIYDNITNASLVATINAASTLVDVVAGASTFIPAPVNAEVFTGGDNGALANDGTPSMSTNDAALYIGTPQPNPTGVHVLDGEQVDIIILAGQSSPTTATSLDSYIQSRGDCIGIYGGYLGETVQDLINRASAGGTVSTFGMLAVAALNSDRAIVTGPGLLFTHPLNGSTVTLWGAYMAAAYAGRVSSIDPFRSPSHKNINGILGLELKYTENDVLNLTLGRVSPVTKFQTLGFLIRNGLTTSSDAVFSQISNRRLVDQIIQGLTVIFTPLISEPNNDTLAGELATGADAFMGRLAVDQGGFGPAIQVYNIVVHATALDKLARQIFVDVDFLQNPPADYIRLRLKPSDANLVVTTNP